MSALEQGALVQSGALSPRDITEAYLERAHKLDPAHEIYVRLTKERARAEADAATARAKAGLRRHPLDGVPLSWKDLFDTQGTITAAGSRAMRTRIPQANAEVLAHATQSGSICLGKTAMTELAFSGLGINPTCGTPRNAFDDKIARAPGGSSAGAAVALARGLCAGSIGTDTGGSVRIPAAWNGLVGLKTTAGRLSLKGTVPLSPTFDTVGPLARNVADANALYALLTGDTPTDLTDMSLNNIVLALPGGVGWSDLGEGIAEAVDAALRKLVHKGIRLVERPISELDAIDALAWGGGASRLVAEAYAQWSDMLTNNKADIFPPVYDRVMAGATITAEDLAKADAERNRLSLSYLDTTKDVDAVVMPTVAISPPIIAPIAQGGPDYFKTNRMVLRNTTLGNQLGLCAITLPVGLDALGLPVGLMLQAPPRAEDKLLQMAYAIEAALH
jgi:aspartyl-tRNA(Asn)/glutamyl-tRNA(Gln) amidotransferase subunit A